MGDTEATDQIRRFEPGDTDAVVALHGRALAAEGTDPDDVPGTRDLQWIEAAYLERGGEFLVAEVGGELVAMGGLAVDDAVGELFRIAVAPGHQREGYGSALVDALERAARERGVERLVLTTARRQDAAVRFYRARGYAETDRERYDGYELIRFEKAIG